MTEISFGSTILEIFWKKSGKGELISLLAPGARNSRYASGLYKMGLGLIAGTAIIGVEFT